MMATRDHTCIHSTIWILFDSILRHLAMGCVRLPCHTPFLHRNLQLKRVACRSTPIMFECDLNGNSSYLQKIQNTPGWVVGPWTQQTSSQEAPQGG